MQEVIGADKPTRKQRVLQMISDKMDEIGNLDNLPADGDSPEAKKMVEPVVGVVVLRVMKAQKNLDFGSVESAVEIVGVFAKMAELTLYGEEQAKGKK